MAESTLLLVLVPLALAIALVAWGLFSMSQLEGELQKVGGFEAKHFLIGSQTEDRNWAVRYRRAAVR
jgi:hypothetical protein